jgi:ArsR family metal-binding transcriptional regulator
MLIDAYDLELISPACDPGSERFAAFANLHQDIDLVLPYLNAVCEGAIYEQAAGVLTMRLDGRAVSIRSRQIGLSNLEDREQASLEMERLVALINRTWERREEIVPDCHKRQRPAALAIYRLLPGGNCKVCGQPTCFIFATKLSAGQAAVEACVPLFTDAHAGTRASLLTLLSAAT